MSTAHTAATICGTQHHQRLCSNYVWQCCVPAASYNALLEVCIRSNDLDRGMDVIDRMDVDGVEPDEFTEAIVSKKRALRSYFKKQLGY